MSSVAPQLYGGSLRFGQDGNTCGSTDELEILNVDFVFQLPDTEPFIVLRTEGWSMDSVSELEFLNPWIAKLTPNAMV